VIAHASLLLDGNGKKVRGTDENEREWMERKRKGIDGNG
jgi:hypothetical protein